MYQDQVSQSRFYPSCISHLTQKKLRLSDSSHMRLVYFLFPEFLLEYSLMFRVAGINLEGGDLIDHCHFCHKNKVPHLNSQRDCDIDHSR